MKQLAVTADDFGLDRELDEGIRETCTAGVVTHVSLMANGGTSEEAAEFLKKSPQLSAGIHLNLTDGQPLSNPKSLGPLVDARGRFRGLHRDVLFAVLRRPALVKGIEQEFKAQIERILGRGVRAAQLNCHGHLHGFPVLFGLLVRLARHYQIPFLRVVDEKAGAFLFLRSPKRWLKTSLLRAGFHWARLRHLLPASVQGVKGNRCVGVFDSGHLTRSRLSSILSNLPDGFSELACHPGISTEDLRRCRPWNYHWDEERELLCSRAPEEEMKRLSIRRVNFWEALEHS